MALHPLVKLMVKSAVPVPRRAQFIGSLLSLPPVLKEFSRNVYYGGNISRARQQMQQAFQQHLPLMWQRMAQARAWRQQRAAQLAAQQAAFPPDSPQAIVASAVQELNKLDKIYGPSTRDILTMARQKPFIEGEARKLFTVRGPHPKPMIQVLREMVENARQRVQAMGYKNFQEYVQSPKFQQYMSSLEG